MLRFARNDAYAFTLAEVLITLGIIGIVAALTLPNLIADYKKKVYVEQLKKSVSVLEQGFQKILTDDGVDSLEDTEMFKSLSASYSASSNSASFEEYLNKYFKIISIDYKSRSGFKYLSGSGLGTIFLDGAFVFADGTIVYNPNFFKNAMRKTDIYCERLKRQGGNKCTLQGKFVIDINGFKKPNQLGRDIFYFYLADDGHLVPQYGHDYYESYWRNSTDACGVPDKPITPSSPVSTGTGCAARIIENGWVMDY